MITSLNTVMTGIASAAEYGGPGYGHHFMDRWGHMMPFGGMFFWIILIIGAIILISLFARRSGANPDKTGPGRETPMDILKKRYARGELSKEEFQRLKQDIQ